VYPICYDILKNGNNPLATDDKSTTVLIYSKFFIHDMSVLSHFAMKYEFNIIILLFNIFKIIYKIFN